MSCVISHHRYTGGKPNGPVLENANEPEVATPTYKRGFVTPKIQAVRDFAHRLMVTGGMGISAKTAARLNPCFEHPVHLLRFKTQTVGSLASRRTQDHDRHHTGQPQRCAF